MARATDQRRQDLRNKLIDIAEGWIAEDGLARIKARPLAKEADCAVGAIYNVFSDLNQLVLAVNGRTFSGISAHVAAVKATEYDDPEDVLVALGHAYLSFAIANPNSWRTLFEVELTGKNAPDWYLQELQKLFTIIAHPLSQVMPDLDADAVQMMTRAMFSSVHGIVLLGLELRISGGGTDQLEQMIEMVVRRVSRKI